MLIITEKPSVAREFAKALKAEKVAESLFKTKDGKTTITHCLGHLMEMAEPADYEEKFRKWAYEDLPIIPGEIKFKPIEKTRKILTTVTKAIKEAKAKGEEILVATDAGREGEVIARLVLEKAGAENYKGKMYRFWESEALSEFVIERGIANKKALGEYDKLAETGKAWKICDWLYGINMTRLYTIKNKKLETIGRVQTAVLNKIYEREVERDTFKESKYTEFEVKFTGNLKALLLAPNGKGTKFQENSGYIEKAKKELEQKKWLQVVSQKAEEKMKNPPQLYNITDLERDAFKKYNFEPEQTLRYVQTLYEEHKSVSYPRTPSRVMGESNVEMVKNIYKEQLYNNPTYRFITDESKICIGNKRLFNNKELEDHHALVPLKFMKNDGTNEHKVWEMIKDRFMMQMMDKNITERIELKLENGEYQYVVVGVREKQKGWKTVAAIAEEQAEEKEEEISETYLTGEKIEITGSQINGKKTKPKVLYNYDTILGYMQNPTEEEGEKLIGIGTPATRQEILKTLERRKYIEKEKKYLRITAIGSELIEDVRKNDLLVRNISAETTTEWERVASNNPAELLENTKTLIREVVKKMEGQMGIETEREEIGKCPTCETGVMFEGEKNYYCKNYKEENGGCKANLYKHINGIEITKEMAKTFFKTGQIGYFSGVNKEGEDVSFAVSTVEKQIKVLYAGETKPIGKCPWCGKGIKTGKQAYYCEGYKSDPPCNYSLWKNASGATFTVEMAAALLNGETLSDVVCMNKEKQEYKAGFRLNKGVITKIVYGGTKKEKNEQVSE